MKLLNTVQQKLKAPKNQKNTFSDFNYRSCEDILEAIKPHLGDGTLILNDEVVQIGDRYYVKATATLSDGKDTISASAYAREAQTKVKFDEAQITGAASSYARKYALNGLFCIDDTKDADSEESVAKPAPTATVAPKTSTPQPHKTTGQQQEAMRARILQLCDEIAIEPLLGDEDHARYILENTGREFIPHNYMEIGLKLKAMHA